MREFKKLGEATSREIFSELSFCILCANYSAERSMRIQAEIGDGFITLPKPELAERLRKAGHRFPESRASYIVSARRYLDKIKGVLETIRDPMELREWLARNIPGIGLKEASHFLRNVGHTDLAIIDFHILDILARHGVIKKPKTMTRRRYLMIEERLRGIANRVGLNMAQLDLYLWYLETGKVLK